MIIINIRNRKLDGLVNCATYDKVVSIEDLTIEEYRHELDVNVVAIYKLIIFSIISISSILFIAKHFFPKSFIEAPK